MGGGRGVLRNLENGLSEFILVTTHSFMHYVSAVSSNTVISFVVYIVNLRGVGGGVFL